MTLKKMHDIEREYGFFSLKRYTIHIKKVVMLMVYDNKNSVYAGLKAYLDTLVADYGLHLVIKDFVGFFEQDMELYHALHAYIIHKTSYCMTIKENHRLWKYCLYSKELLYKKLVKNPEPFIGQCYGGVVEYVLPIVHKKQVIGAITIGYGRLDHKVLEDILKGLNKHTHMDIPILQDYYIESTDVESISPQGLDQRLGILAEYISLIYRPANVLKEKRHCVIQRARDVHYVSCYSLHSEAL